MSQFGLDSLQYVELPGYSSDWWLRVSGFKLYIKNTNDETAKEITLVITVVIPIARLK